MAKRLEKSPLAASRHIISHEHACISKKRLASSSISKPQIVHSPTPSERRACMRTMYLSKCACGKRLTRRYPSQTLVRVLDAKIVEVAFRMRGRVNTSSADLVSKGSMLSLLSRGKARIHEFMKRGSENAGRKPGFERHDAGSLQSR